MPHVRYHGRMTTQTPVTYEYALATFRDLCEDLVFVGFDNEYVRGGVNLIADCFGVAEMPVDERMEEVLSDLQALPMFAPRTKGTR